MALAAIEHPSPVQLLTDAVDLVRAAARPGPRPVDPVTAACLRALLVDLAASTEELAEELAAELGEALPPPGPTPLAVVAHEDAGGGRAARPGSLRLRATAEEVRLTGRGPVAEGDLVRAALHHRAGATGSPAQQQLGGLLWSALVALSRDGLEPPTALPTPLGLVGRGG